MDNEVENFELSLDGRSRSNSRDGLSHFHSINYPFQFRGLANKFAHEKNRKARRKLLEMFGIYLLNFKRSILINRRRRQHRFQRRQESLRSFFLQHLLELETSLLEFPLVPRVNGMCENKGRLEMFDASFHISNFFEDVMGIIYEEDWLSNFHMKKSTFEWLCDQLMEIALPMGKNSDIGKTMCHKKQVALGLKSFALGINYVKVSGIFETQCSSTIFTYMKCFAEAIIKKLGRHYLSMPVSEEECNEIGHAFYKASNMPTVAIGVLGVCELRIKPLKQVANTDSENSTIIMQVLIDNKLLFRKVKLDSNQPTLFLEEKNEITNLSAKFINNHLVSRFIVTPDTYYPLRKWLMHKYHDPVETHEIDFNEAVEKLIDFKNCALKRLFSRWRILKLNGDVDLRTMEKIAVACCILHNILERNEEPFDEKLTNWQNIDKTPFTMSTRFKPVLNVLPGKAYSSDVDGAADMRKFLGLNIGSKIM